MSSPKVSFNEYYLQWRNRTRKYSRKSMIVEALQTLKQPNKDKLTELRGAPWLTCLLVKWICQDRMLDHGVGPAITRQAFADLCQRLWDLPEHTNLGTRDSLPLHLFIRQILRAQAGFQRRVTRGFLREAALLQQLPANDPVRILFETKSGVGVQDFIDLTLVIYAAVVGGAMGLTSNWFSPMRKAYSQDSIDGFLTLVSRDIAGLVKFCRSLPNADAKKASEFHEFPALTRYPFLSIGGTLQCWHPQVFYRGMEGMVHSILSEEGQEYIDRFSKVFEKHVVAEAKTLGVPFHGEDTIQKWLPPHSEVPDGLLSYPHCNVFIESKAGIFDESVMTVGHSEMFSHKTRALRKAVSQTWTASTALREQGRAPSNVMAATSDYLLIVTNKELSASGGTVLEKIYPKGTLAPPSSDALERLPLSHIYVVSIEDFERLAAAVRRAEIDLPAFLADCVQRDSDPATSSFYFEQHLDRHKIPWGYSAIVDRVWEEASGRVEVALGRSPLV